MTSIIDRRSNNKDKSLRNRQRFVQKSRRQIRQAVKESIDKGKIADIEKDKVKIPVKGSEEPTFSNDPKTGNKRYVMPGNKKYVVGDKEPKPEEGGGGGGTEGGLGEGEDEFYFVLNKDEYLDFIFEDLELPDLVKKQIKDVTKTRPRRAGFTNSGNPSQLDVVRSLRNSMGRRIGLGRPTKEQITELQEKIKKEIDTAALELLEQELAELLRRQKVIPWLDPVDVRYRNYEQQPQPVTQAVMFCVMDVSGSMGQREKDLAKRFYFLLHMFLHRKYEKVEIVFIRHHQSASEVTEDEFFYSQESGGTVVSSGLNLTKTIIEARYNPADWNIYVAQASDGDNFTVDRNDTIAAMSSLLPMVQYFAYVEISRVYGSISINKDGTDLWTTYEPLLAEHHNLKMKQVRVTEDIWKVFKELFKKES